MNKSACWHLEKPCQPCLVKQFIFVMFTQELPLEPGVQDGYILQLVLLSIFLAVTLVLLSVLLIACRRCCEGDQSYARWDKSLSYQQMQTCDWQVNSRIIYLFTTAEETLQTVMNLCFSKKEKSQMIVACFFKKSDSDPQIDWLRAFLIEWLTDCLADWRIHWLIDWLTKLLTD